MIKGEEFILRKLRKEDAESIAKYANNKKIADNLTESFPHPYNLKDGKDFVKMTIDEDNPLNLGVEIEDEIVGMIGIAGKKDFTKSIGYWIGEPFWGKGIMTKAVKKVIKEAFKDQKLERIEGRVYLHNIGSAKVLKKLGFKKEGIARKASRIHDGTVVDEEVYSLIREDLEY